MKITIQSKMRPLSFLILLIFLAFRVPTGFSGPSLVFQNIFKHDFVTVQFLKDAGSRDSDLNKKKKEWALLTATLLDGMPKPYVDYFKVHGLTVTFVPGGLESQVEQQGAWFCQDTLGFVRSDGAIFIREAVLQNVRENEAMYRMILFHEAAHILNDAGKLPGLKPTSRDEKEMQADLTAVFWEEILKGEATLENPQKYEKKYRDSLSKILANPNDLFQRGSEIAEKAMASESLNLFPEGKREIFLLEVVPLNAEWHQGFDLLIEFTLSNGVTLRYLGHSRAKAFQRFDSSIEIDLIKKNVKGLPSDNKNLLQGILRSRMDLATRLGIKPERILPYTFEPTEGSILLELSFERPWGTFPKLYFRYRVGTHEIKPIFS